tara:strand:- start:903 stop:1550 length:648 start_codon:yes stop_codon:yes gene_type:complete
MSSQFEFSAANVSAMRSKILQFLGPKTLKEGYEALKEMFSSAKTRAERQAVLGARLNILRARIDSLKLGLVGHSNVDLKTLLVKLKKEEFYDVDEGVFQKDGEADSAANGDKQQWVAVRMIEDVTVLGSFFKTGTNVQVPSDKAEELVRDSKAEVYASEDSEENKVSGETEETPSKVEDISDKKDEAVAESTSNASSSVTNDSEIDEMLNVEKQN